MPVSLQTALTNHQVTDFDKIGVKHWVYLSYDQSHGWDLVKFEGICGIFQQFFRWLGFYGGTHLKTIAAQIERETAVPAALLAKVRSSWQRQGHQPVGTTIPPAVPPVAAQALPRVQEEQAQLDPQPLNANHQGFYVLNGEAFGTLISIEQGDITQMPRVKAIVNAANPACLGGGGIDGVIHAAAGADLLAECQGLPEVQPGIRCQTGNAVITRSGNLLARGIERIIHTVGPDMRLNPPNGEQLLRNAYINSLDLAHANGIRTIAFPAISTGIYGYDFDAAAALAVQTVEQYAHDHPGRFNEIKLIYFTEADWQRVAWTPLFHPHAVRDRYGE